MKTLKTKLAAFIVISLLSIATKAVNTTSSSLKFAILLSKNITVPEQLKVAGFSEKVKVVFKLDKDKKVSEVIAQTSNALLRKSLEDQLKAMNFNDYNANTTYNVVLNLHVY